MRSKLREVDITDQLLHMIICTSNKSAHVLFSRLYLKIYSYYIKNQLDLHSLHLSNHGQGTIHFE